MVLRWSNGSRKKQSPFYFLSSISKQKCQNGIFSPGNFFPFILKAILAPIRAENIY